MFLNDIFENGDDLFSEPRNELGKAIREKRWGYAASECIKVGARNPTVESNIIPGILRTEGRNIVVTWDTVRDWYEKFIAPNAWPELEQYVAGLKTKATINAGLTNLIYSRYGEANNENREFIKQTILAKHAADAATAYISRLGNQQRWPEMEPYIMVSPRAAMWYAAGVLKSRWPEAEPYIATDRVSWSMYAARALDTNNGTQAGRASRDAAQQEALKRLPADHKKRIAEEDEMFAVSTRASAQKAIKDVLDTNYNRYMEHYNEIDPEQSGAEDMLNYYGDYLSDYDHLRSELARGGITGFLRGLDMVSQDVINTVDGDLAIRHKVYMSDLENQYDPIDEDQLEEDTDPYDDEDMFAPSNRISASQDLSKVTAHLSRKYATYADTSTDEDTAELYTNESYFLGRASTAFLTGLRAGFKELEDVEDASTWEDLHDLCDRKGIDISALADQYDAGELSESEDDMFAPRNKPNLRKISTDQLRMLYQLSKGDSRPEYASAHKLQMAAIKAELERRSAGYVPTLEEQVNIPLGSHKGK